MILYQRATRVFDEYQTLYETLKSARLAVKEKVLNENRNNHKRREYVEEFKRLTQEGNSLLEKMREANDFAIELAGESGG